MRLNDLKRILAIGLFGLLFINSGSTFAWDGRWTNAWSGEVGLFHDPGSSQGTSGFDPPQKYYTASPRNFADVDPDELADYLNRYKKEYSPYALARITYNIRYNDLVIPKGYYLIKAGDANEGSKNVNLRTLNPPPVSKMSEAGSGSAPSLRPMAEELPAVDTETIYPSSKAEAPPPADVTPTLKSDEPPYLTFVIKQKGRVIAVVPIHRMEVYHPKRNEHAHKQALAWVEIEERHPVLKFYYRKHIYSTDFQ
jgi:hypothetical protein